MALQDSNKFHSLKLRIDSRYLRAIYEMNLYLSRVYYLITKLQSMENAFTKKCIAKADKILRIQSLCR
jgi:hypothetical protein